MYESRNITLQSIPISNQILNKSPGFDYISTMEWPLVLCLLGTWVLVFLCLFRGIKMSGKVCQQEI